MLYLFRISDYFEKSEFECSRFTIVILRYYFYPGCVVSFLTSAAYIHVYMHFRLAFSMEINNNNPNQTPQKGSV